jgi:hypothetical protein
VRAQIGRATRSGFTLGEVDDRRSPPARSRGQQRPSTGELDVIAMRGDCENVDGHGEGR